jgi:hypothetical protein
MLWWLADPLYSVPGNERLTDHYTRLVLNEILARSETVRRSRWGDDNRELLVRYGRIVGWERSRSSSGSLGRDNVIGHHRKGGLRLIPPGEFVEDLSTIQPGSWDLEPERPRSTYAPSYATEMVWLFHNIALFRRGDSAVVVSTIAVPERSTTRDDASTVDPESLEIALVLSEEPSVPPTVRRRKGLGAITARVRVAPTLVSTEALARADSLAARARYWLDIPERLRPRNGDLTMSDLLMIDPPAELPDRLERAIEHARPPGPVARGARVGFYWEMYGQTSSVAPAMISVTVEKTGKNLFRRAGEWLGLVGERKDRIEMRWREDIKAADYTPRAIAVQLTPEMEGTYVVTIGVRLDTGDEARATRRIEVR